MTIHGLSPEVLIKLQYLKEALRPGKTKFVVASDFRKDFVKIYESVEKGEANYIILRRGNYSASVMHGDIAPVILQLVDLLIEQANQERNSLT